jgi:hypothetical protein
METKRKSEEKSKKTANNYFRLFNFQFKKVQQKSSDQNEQ